MIASAIQFIFMLALYCAIIIVSQVWRRLCLALGMTFLAYGLMGWDAWWTATALFTIVMSFPDDGMLDFGAWNWKG